MEALTQSEPARQALMRHSTELRQDLQDQGLVLEKFMVDVNRDKSGGGNHPEGNKAGGKIAPPSKAAKVQAFKPAGHPRLHHQNGRPVTNKHFVNAFHFRT